MVIVGSATEPPITQVSFGIEASGPLGGLRRRKASSRRAPTCVLAARMLQSIRRASITYLLEDGNVLTWVDLIGIVIRATPPLRSNFCLALV